ncbi:hypothetical protein [Neobacillus thermocopriae]|uniref:Uncharacterized protein n=1 Tax=Neobacillus thermocopriae TaxID=1215031 RepID=A0A6B3TQ54_9BACI|nr:hypothetical protein [Neobacillus thermocopriae]MED3624442.1 hypothetical protein [Neobacillus thermocopriae]MED3714833.1 hypothetical protein [Neobacillus thermocopriae]NEX78728.1 hypothetical protein [Neobacillus thermocopriae]
MINKEVIRQNIGLILSLGAIALIRPIMKITGIIHWFGSERFGSIFMTILISLIWLIIVVMKNCQHPVQILVFAGISYAVFATILSAILSPILHGQLQGPITNPLALISIIVTNSIWGLLIGVLAMPFIKKKTLTEM